MVRKAIPTVTNQSFRSQQFQPRPTDWPSYWVETTRRLCRGKKMDETRFSNCKAKLHQLFTETRCHPKKISPEKLKSFLTITFQNEHHLYDDTYMALQHLYQHLSIQFPSETYQLLSTIKTFKPTTIDDLIGQFITYLKLKKRSVRTIRNYSYALRKYLYYTNKMPVPDDRKQIEAYLLRLQDIEELAPRTVNLHAASIISFYKNIINAHISVSEIPRMKPGSVLPKVYGQGDIGKILDVGTNRKHILVIMLVYGCGLRLEEIRVLRVADIDWDRHVIRINGKGSKQRDIPIDECFGTHLRWYLSENPGLIYLFEGIKRGKPYARRTIQKIYENACKKSKVNRKGGIHSLRHSYATHLLELGVDINKIKVLLGHSSVKTTQIYTHVSREEIAKIRSPLSTIKTPTFPVTP